MTAGRLAVRTLGPETDLFRCRSSVLFAANHDLGESRAPPNLLIFGTGGLSAESSLVMMTP